MYSPTSLSGMRRFGWGNDDEKEFLHGLGRHAKTKCMRLELLKRYEAALLQRARWGGLSFQYVLAEVRRQIRQEFPRGVVTAIDIPKFGAH